MEKIASNSKHICCGLIIDTKWIRAFARFENLSESSEIVEGADSDDTHADSDSILRVSKQFSHKRSFLNWIRVH